LKPNTNSIFSVNSEDSFVAAALAVFNYQATENPVYKRYLATLKIDASSIKTLAAIPFLPVGFFKTHEIITGNTSPGTVIFSSSGTTGMTQSKHYVNDVSLYEKSYLKAFRIFYGDITDYSVLALLPSYLEREGSSLIYMVDDLIKKSNHSESSFYLDDLDQLILTLEKLEQQKQKSILIGVTYALLDLIGKRNFKLKYTIIMETGGMKGKRKEMVREELHDVLCKGFGVDKIHSEYGMTELLSQAYSKGDGIFECPPWMKIMIRDVNDPFTFIGDNKSGGINIIDLANINSCAFISTQDLGKTFNNGTFEVLGRFDNSDVRGCNLLVQ
jgi:phenylacetate-coenzyme A ligase PaaK-like adenylate-forming protein